MHTTLNPIDSPPLTIMHDHQRKKSYANLRDIEEKYEFGNVLGEGAYSEVYQAMDVDTREKVAIKAIVKLSKADRWTNRKGAQKDEVKVLTILNHPKIIKFIDFYDEKEKMYIVQEYCAGGNLQEVIRRQKPLSEARVKNIFHQILQAVSYLHKSDIIHRDIKSENVLLKDKTGDDVRLLDFGLSRLMPRSELATTAVGTLDYKAPEICLRKPYGKECDCWSLGVVLFELLSSKLPCIFSSEEGVVSFAEKGVKFDERWDNISEPAKDLIQHLLVFKPEDRYTCEQALQCEWLTPSPSA